MEVKITGLSNSGKTTVSNALTRRRAHTSSSGEASGRPNLGVASVPAHLGSLADILHPGHVVQPEVQYLDVPSPPKGPARSHRLLGGTNDSDHQSSAELTMTVPMRGVAMGKQERTTKGSI